MLCGAVSWSEMVTSFPRAKEPDNTSFSVNVDDSLTSLQWLLRPLACDVSVPGASGRGSQPGEGPARQREPLLYARLHQTHPVISCRQPVSSSQVRLSPLAADPAPTQTMTLACSLTQKSLPGIVPRGTCGKKPPYTYPMMICMAMQASRKSNIAASCIYQWFMDKFPYFRHHNNPDSWKSSIRHNLSTIKEFISVSRQGNDPGKGGFWTVDPQYAEGILLRALNKWTSDFKKDPSLPSPLMQIPPLPSPPLPSPLPASSLQTVRRPCKPTGGQSVSQQLIRGFDDATSVEQKQPGKEIGKLKRKKRPDSTATMAKIPRRSSSLVLQTEEQKELDGLLDWVLSSELGPIQQHQGPELCSVATSAISCVAPSPPSGALGWLPQSPLVHHQLLDSALSKEPSLDSGVPLSTSPIEDDLTDNFVWDLDLLDLAGELGLYSEEPLSSTSPIEPSLDSGVPLSTSPIEKDVIVTFDCPIEDDLTDNFVWDLDLLDLARELGLYSEEPLSSTSPIEKDVIVTFDFDWDTLLGSVLSDIGQRGGQYRQRGAAMLSLKPKRRT